MKKVNSLLNNQQYKIAKISIVFLFLVVTAALFVYRGHYKQLSFMGGDEPSYIMMTDSLVKDGDFNLKNDYELKRATEYYLGPDLFPHIAVIVDYIQSDKWYSIHTIGLPILLAAPYKIFGMIGARLMMLVLQLASVIFFLKILERYLQDKYRVVIGMLLLLCCTFFWQNIGAVFPDLVLVSVAGASVLLFGRKDIISNVGFVLLVCIGVLVHSKVLVLVGPIYLAHQVFLLASNGISVWVKKYSIYIALGLVFAGLYSWFLYASYGVYLPSQLYGPGGQLFAGNMFANSLAVVLDRAKGLLIYFPVIAVSGPYLYIATRQSIKHMTSFIRKRNVPKQAYLPLGIGAGLLALLITQLGFDDWSGSFGPNGRYMLAFLFVLIFVIAKYINYKNKLELLVLSTATIISALASWVIAKRVDIYLDTGVDNIVTAKYALLKIFPLYPLVIKTSDNGLVYRSVVMILIIALFNALLYLIYKDDKIRKVFTIKSIK